MIACWSVLLSIAIPCILRAVTVIIPAAQGWQSCCFKRTCVGCHRRQVRSDSVGHSRRLDFEHRKSDSRIKLMAANEHIKHGASTGNTSLATSAVTSSSTSIKLVDEIALKVTSLERKIKQVEVEIKSAEANALNPPGKTSVRYWKRQVKDLRIEQASLKTEQVELIKETEALVTEGMVLVNDLQPAADLLYQSTRHTLDVSAITENSALQSRPRRPGQQRTSCPLHQG